MLVSGRFSDLLLSVLVVLVCLVLLLICTLTLLLTLNVILILVLNLTTPSSSSLSFSPFPPYPCVTRTRNWSETPQWKSRRHHLPHAGLHHVLYKLYPQLECHPILHVLKYCSAVYRIIYEYEWVSSILTNRLMDDTDAVDNCIANVGKPSHTTNPYKKVAG